MVCVCVLGHTARRPKVGEINGSRVLAIILAVRGRLFEATSEAAYLAQQAFMTSKGKSNYMDGDPSVLLVSITITGFGGIGSKTACAEDSDLGRRTH